MAHIYIDEAGTSASEPFTVVAGIIVRDDRRWIQATEAVRKLINDFVPDEFRNGFIFHAKAIWNDHIYRNTWSKDDRIAFISAMVSIPRELKLAVSVGKIKQSPNPADPKSESEINHLLAFANCLRRANKHIQDCGKSNELATVVAEDVSDKRKKLKSTLQFVRECDAHIFSPNQIHLTIEEQLTGKVLQTGAGKVDRIVDTVHFVKKDEAPLVQIADACAFVFRRFFADQEYGDFWIEAMLGEPLILEDWQSKMSSYVFDFNRTHSDLGWKLSHFIKMLGGGHDESADS